LLPVASDHFSTQYQLVHLKRYSDTPAMEIFRSLLLETLQRE